MGDDDRERTVYSVSASVSLTIIIGAIVAMPVLFLAGVGLMYLL